MITISQKEVKETIKLANMTIKEIQLMKLKPKEEKKLLKKVGIARMRVQTFDPEDIQIMIENEQARTMFSVNGIRNLYKAICHQAVHDYKWSTKYLAKGKGKKKDLEEAEQIMHESKSFFNSDFFKNVSGCHDPNKTVEAIEQLIKKEATEKMKTNMS